MFYVTMIRAKRVAVLSGSYDMLEAAEMVVDVARQKAIDIGAWHWFDAFGVAKYDCEKKSAFGVLTVK